MDDEVTQHPALEVVEIIGDTFGTAIALFRRGVVDQGDPLRLAKKRLHRLCGISNAG